MDVMHQFIDQNMPLLYFLYGLSFFMLGLVAAIQYRSQSKLKLVRNLWILSLFGLTHGLYEWGHVFIPIQTISLAKEYTNWVNAGHVFLLILSFSGLLQFAINLLVDESVPGRRLAQAMPGVAFVLWGLAFLGGISIMEDAELYRYIVNAEIMGRYLFAFPGAVLSGIALIVLNRDLVGPVLLKARGASKVVSVSFYFYALFSGLIVPESTFFPANLLNTSLFHEQFGMPVEVFRMLTLFIMTYYIFSLLEHFEEELTGRLEWAECQYSVLNERLRISRDLHDGILQSVYAMGLRCENMKHLIESDPTKAKAEIDSSLGSFNQLISEIRTFIGALRVDNTESKTLHTQIEGVVREFSARTQIPTHGELEDLRNMRICPKIADQVAGIVREALNNVARHAEASEVNLEVQNGKRGLWLRISDNGKGFKQPALWRTKFSLVHQGITNMRDRAKILGGELEVSSKPGRGTTISLYLPQEGLNQMCGGGFTCGCDSQTYSSNAR